MQDYHSFIGEVLIEEEQLKKRVKELGEDISRDYHGKEILAICILGAV